MEYLYELLDLVDLAMTLAETEMDSVAAITGNILGAWNGLDGIDETWYKPLRMDYFLTPLKEYGEIL